MKEKEGEETKIKKEEKEKTDKINKENAGDQKERRHVSSWDFIYGKDLQGFHFAFIAMFLFPIISFYVIRYIFFRLHFSKNECDVFAVVGSIVSVWIILISYIVYYFRNDFYQFFHPNQQKDKKDKKE